MEKITSFTIDHIKLQPGVYVSRKDPVGGEVITTPFTFASTTHAIVRSGLTPVFCDVNDRNYTIDVTKIEALITEKTVAIVPVHVYGNMCDVDEIKRIADKHGLKVIYDAAHAFGVTYKGVGVGNFGDASMFSFHATKVFHTNTGIIGTMGTGKTQFTKSLITQLYREQRRNFDGSPMGILIFDYKGDYNSSKCS